ncbi:hypothetical protein XaraCFBP7407_12790 [Xanthomonas arboricola pv. arracaciae]|nr:hypothetical protein XaraCFBP7407_12790 [Xanthomonas arboricola pv. arracaciae]
MVNFGSASELILFSIFDILSSFFSSADILFSNLDIVSSNSAVIATFIGRNSFLAVEFFLNICVMKLVMLI